MELARLHNDYSQELFTTSNYLDLIVDQGNSAEARQLWARIQQLRDALPSDTLSQRSIMAKEGLFLYHTGQVEEGLQFLETFRKSVQDAQDLQNIIGIDYNLADIYLHLKECEFRFNCRNRSIYLVVLKLLREKPLS
jgi:hypothetical protein